MGGIESVPDLTIYSGVAVLTIDSPPVNALSVIVREAIAILIDQVVANPDVDALVQRCAGRTFFTGADISEFGRPVKGWPSYRGGPMLYAESVGRQGVLKKLEDFESKFGGDFAPSARLRELVAEGEQLQDLSK